MFADMALAMDGVVDHIVAFQADTPGQVPIARRQQQVPDHVCRTNVNCTGVSQRQEKNNIILPGGGLHDEVSRFIHKGAM